MTIKTKTSARSLIPSTNKIPKICSLPWDFGAIILVRAVCMLPTRYVDVEEFTVPISPR